MKLPKHAAAKAVALTASALALAGTWLAVRDDPPAQVTAQVETPPTPTRTLPRTTQATGQTRNVVPAPAPVRAHTRTRVS